MARRQALGDTVPETPVDEQAMDEEDRLAGAEVAVGDVALGDLDGGAVAGPGRGRGSGGGGVHLAGCSDLVDNIQTVRF